MLWCSLALLALLASAQGRAVNISNTWVLPEEGFPVFYRYFRDRISWYEADAVCQFHHANLVTVDTTAQYDAVRAYLKELDISSAVWVGLIRSNPDGDFTWTDYRGLSGDGYWSSAPDTRSAPLCAAADPAADYRWEARACGGPTVASFICELPVPQWALGNEGCMIRALPALTILYLPESAAVQLTADCGLAGVKKVQCTGNVKHEDLLKELSCADEDELSSMSSSISTDTNWPASTDTFTDIDTTNEVTTEDTITTAHESDINQPRAWSTSIPHFIYAETQYKPLTKLDNINSFNNVLISKNVNLGEHQDNNAHSNYIPKITGNNNILTNEQLEKIEDARHMQHKLLHEEIARVGNVENIFTQPTDHFIPPLVMAKAKISDDMTVLSLAEKHAQQLAEKEFTKQNMHSIQSHVENYDISSKLLSSDDKDLITSVKPTKYKDSKKDVLKSSLPKKYMNKKPYDMKNKMSKNIETKIIQAEKTTEASTTEQIRSIQTTTQKVQEVSDINNDETAMDLTVMLKDAPISSGEQSSFSGDVSKLATIANTTSAVNGTVPKTLNSLNMTKPTKFVSSTTPEMKPIENITIAHEIIKITIIADDPTINTTVFEISTKMPVFRDNSTPTTTLLPSTHKEEVHSTDIASNYQNGEKSSIKHEITTTPYTQTMESESATITISNTTTKTMTENTTTAQPLFNFTENITSIKIDYTMHKSESINKTELVDEVKVTLTTTSLPHTTDLETNTSQNTTNLSNITIDNADLFNITDMNDILDKNFTSSDEFEENGDFHSPLLSGSYEPIHRPPRTRRPQQPNRKFNPFRILG